MLGRIERLVGCVLVAAVVCAAPAMVLGQATKPDAKGTTSSAATMPATTRASTMAAATSAPTTEPVAATRPADAPNPALSERIAYQMAQGLLRSRPLTAQSWPATVAMLEGSLRLNPNEPRIMRLLIEAVLREGDTQRAIEVLSRYRSTDEGKDDQGAQVQSIDLYVSQLDSLEKKIAYLQDVVGRAGIAAPVRSHAAVRAAELLAEHMQDAEALQMVDQALRTNPLNLRALRIKYEMLRGGTPSERLAGMLEMLKSNPAQPGLVLAVAQDLADAGLVQPALQWYTLAVNMYYRNGTIPAWDVLMEYASEIYISGDAHNADQFMQRVNAQDPNLLNGWLLRLVVLKSMGDKDALAAGSRQAQIAMTNRLAMLKRTAGDQTATTRPVDPASEVPPVDVAADLARIQASKNEDLVNQFAVVAQGMAWLKIYFDEKPADADPWLNGLAKVVPANDAILARLQGWQALKAGKPDAARAKLQTVAKDDPLSAAGLILIAPNDPASQEKAASEGRALLSKNPSGLAGAALLEMLSPKNVRLVPGQLADQLSAELMKFPKDWMHIVEAPQQFYSLRIEPVRSALQVGDPVLVKVTIMNIGDFDLTVGPEGILHQDLWFDAQLRGAQQDVLQSETFDRITKRLVLPARQSMSQVVRLDSIQLSSLLLQAPQKVFQLVAMVMTNPVTVQGQISTGPGGYKVAMPSSRMMERQGTNLTTAAAQQKLTTTMLNGTSSDKVQAVELVATYFQLLSSAEDPQTKQMAAPYGEGVRRGAIDADPGVRAWSLYVLSLLTGDQDRPAVIRTMVQDPSWHARLLASVSVALTGQGKDVLKPLEKDEDPIVAKLAAAVGKMPVIQRQQAPAGTGPGAAPVTQPTSAPAGAPAAHAPGGTAPGAAAPSPGAAPAGATSAPPRSQGGISLPSAAPGEPTPTLSTGAPPSTSPSVP